jgi:hypothetical protein
MDARAKSYGRKWKGRVLGPMQLSTERWSITVNGLKHSKFNKEEIYELRKEETSKIYWQWKDVITDQAWKDTNWQASKGALKEMPRGFRRFHTKHASRHCAVGKMMKLRKQ